MGSESTFKSGLNTRYNGYNFRSRVEARWALFFDELGIFYEYEPQMFPVDVDESYLPDFFLDVPHSDVMRSESLQERGLWAEVKHVVPTAGEKRRAATLAKITALPAVFLVGDPKVGPYPLVLPGEEMQGSLYSWCMCPVCREVSLVWPWTPLGEEHCAIGCCDHQLAARGRKQAIRTARTAVETAINKARAARFGVWE